MAWQEDMYSALAELLRERYRKDVDVVVGFEDRTVYGGGCETCAYSYLVCDITYLDSEGDRRNFEYDGSFADLLAHLARYSANK